MNKKIITVFISLLLTLNFYSSLLFAESETKTINDIKSASLDVINGEYCVNVIFEKEITNDSERKKLKNWKIVDQSNKEIFIKRISVPTSITTKIYFDLSNISAITVTYKSKYTANVNMNNYISSGKVTSSLNFEITTSKNIEGDYKLAIPVIYPKIKNGYPLTIGGSFTGSLESDDTTDSSASLTGKYIKSIIGNFDNTKIIYLWYFDANFGFTSKGTLKSPFGQNGLTISLEGSIELPFTDVPIFLLHKYFNNYRASMPLTLTCNYNYNIYTDKSILNEFTVKCEYEISLIPQFIIKPLYLLDYNIGENIIENSLSVKFGIPITYITGITTTSSTADANFVYIKGEWDFDTQNFSFPITLGYTTSF